MKRATVLIVLWVSSISILSVGQVHGQFLEYEFIAKITYASVDNMSWFDTGFDMVPGVSYALVPYGRTRIPSAVGGPDAFGYGPEGGTAIRWGVKGNHGPMDGAPAMALIGRVGVDGEPFCLAEHGSMPTYVWAGPDWAGSGHLYLIVNDNLDNPSGWADNEGTLWVDVYAPAGMNAHETGDGHRAQGALSLSHSQPNPFERSTSIEYRLPGSGNVLLGIYDLQGRLVRTLVNAPESAGNHSVVWDGRNTEGNLLNPGIYFYQLRTEGTIETGKMTLVR